MSISSVIGGGRAACGGRTGRPHGLHLLRRLRAALLGCCGGCGCGGCMGGGCCMGWYCGAAAAASGHALRPSAPTLAAATHALWRHAWLHPLPAASPILLLLRRYLPVALLLWRRLHLALPLLRHLPIALLRRHAWLHPLLRRHLPVALLLRLLRLLRGVLLHGLLRLLRGILLHLPIPSLLLRRL